MKSGWFAVDEDGNLDHFEMQSQERHMTCRPLRYARYSQEMEVPMRFFTICSIVSCFCGGLVFFGTLVGAKSAPQEAAGFAMAATMAIVPYCFVRLLQIDKEIQSTEKSG